jgi:hypothetical protein
MTLKEQKNKPTIYSLVDNEKWKPIWGYPGYEVSNYGRVISHWKMIGRGRGQPAGYKLDPSYTRFIGSPESKTPKKGKGKKAGYVQVLLGRDKLLKESHPISHYNKIKEGEPTKFGIYKAHFPMHKLVMWHFSWLDYKPEQIGISKEEWLSMPERAKVIIRQSLEINHIDHNPTNNKLSNLEWVTKVENSQAYKDSDKYAEYVKETYGVSTILEKRRNIL